MSEKNQLLEGDLAMIIASYMRRIDAGESVDQQRILMDHPHLKAELESYFADVALIELLAGPTASDLIAPAGVENEFGTAAFGAPVDANDSEQPVNQKRAESDKLLEGQFGRYQIEKILGQGAMGAVYLAHDNELERRVALKVPKIEEEEATEELMEGFYREARAAATLEHAGICRVYDVGSQNGISYIAMAYINGPPLSSLIKQAKIKSKRNIGVVVRKLALALESAHQKGVIHRDLKPANIMMKGGKEPVIMDFGLARQLHKEETSRLTVEGTVMGTPAYMSPEQVSGDIDSVGSQSDIYSLGIIFYELLTGGELPFQGPIVVIIGQIIGTEPSPPSSIREGIDPKLEAICLKMMAKKTEDRYQSMQEVVEALTAYLKTQTKRSTDSPEPISQLKEPLKQGKTEQPEKNKRALTLFEKFKNRPPHTKAIAAAACGAVLFLAAAITFFFKMDDRTVEVKLDDPSAVVTFDGKYHVEFEGKNVGHVELDIGRHEVTVTRDGTVVKGWEKFEYIVEKEGKNQLEIVVAEKVADKIEPPTQADAERKANAEKNSIQLKTDSHFAKEMAAARWLYSVGGVTSTARAIKKENKKYDQKFVIRSANLQGCQFDSKDLKYLIDLPALEILTIAESDQEIDDEAIRWIGQCESLRSLRFYNCKLKTSQLAKLPELKNVRFLHISTRHLDDDWKFLSAFPNLSVIAFSSGSADEVPDLTGLGNYPQVRFLSLYDVKSIDPNDVEKLQTENPGIRVLIHFDKQLIGNDPVTPIAKTFTAAGCILEGTHINKGKSGVWDGVSACRFHTLKLEKTSRTTKALWESIPRLSWTYQRIVASKINNADQLLPHLKDAVSIGSLNLAHSDLTDQGLLEFAKQTKAKIANLDVRWTKVTKPGLERFRSFHPDTIFNVRTSPSIKVGKKDHPFLGGEYFVDNVEENVAIPLLILPEDIGKMNQKNRSVDPQDSMESISLPPRLAEMLKQKPFGVQEFDFKRKPDRDDYGTRVYEKGQMVIDSSSLTKKVRAWPLAAGYSSGLVQVDVRTIKGNGWGVVFHNKILKRGFRIWLDGKKLGFGPSIWGSGEQMEILTDKAPTNGLNQYDQMHILVEGRTITVFLNGEQCGAPVELDFDLGRHDVAPGIVSDTNFTKVEFERILWFALTKKPEPKKPEQEFKTSHLRLSDILKQKAVDVQEFDFKRNPERDGGFVYSVQEGRQFVESKPGNYHAAWPFAEHDASGLAQIDVRTVEGCGWMVVFHDDALNRGIRIEMKNGSLNFGTSLFGLRSKSLTPTFRTLIKQAPTHGLNQFDRLHILIEGRTITVFLNGKRCGDPVELDFDLGRYKVCTGAVNVSSKSITRVEFERILQFSLHQKIEEPEFKTSDKRLIEILKQKPVFEEEFKTNHVHEKNEKWLREERDGRSIFQYTSFDSGRTGYWFWGKGKAAPSGLIQIDVRLVKGYGWLQSFHDANLKYGFHVTMRNGELRVGPDYVLSPHPSTPIETVLTRRVPTNGLGNWDRLHILLEGRKITVFLNGKQCGDPVELERALTECSFFPGLIAFGDGKTTRVEYERILQFPLVD